MASRQGDGDRAVRAAERAVALERERKGAPGSGFEALSALATAYLVTGRTAPADHAFRELVAVLESQGLERTRDAVTILNNWSVVLGRAGQSIQAAPIAERAVRIARERDTERGAGATELKNLGTALCRVGRSAEAVPLLKESVTKARAAGSPRRLVEAAMGMATAYREVGELDRAAQALREAEATVQTHPEMAHSEYAALVEGHQARLALARGKAREGLALARSARNRQEDPVHSTLDTLFLTLVLAEAENANVVFEEARVSAQSALNLANVLLREGELTHSSHVGEARLELAIALAGEGDLRAARNELQQALDHLRPSVGPEAPSTRRAVSELARLMSTAPATP
jgi:tetratricopeptide (TPR) repeat protein